MLNDLDLEREILDILVEGVENPYRASRALQGLTTEYGENNVLYQLTLMEEKGKIRMEYELEEREEVVGSLGMPRSLRKVVAVRPTAEGHRTLKLMRALGCYYSADW